MVALVIVGYVLIGFIVGGVTAGIIGGETDVLVLLTTVGSLFWPLMILGGIGYLFAKIPYRVGLSLRKRAKARLRARNSYPSNRLIER